MKKTILKTYLYKKVKALIKEPSSIEHGWYGNFKSWEEALAKSKGYDSEEVIKKVLESSLKVKRGEGAFERDSIVFSTLEFNWPLLGCLLWVANQDRGRLNLIDFGGALGSIYYQHKKLLENVSPFSWNVIEQHQFVDLGNQFFADHSLKFYYDLKSCTQQQTPNCVLLSSVLPYIEKPYALLEEILALKIRFLIINRHPLITSEQDLLTVQNVSPKIYKASYPAWFFSKEKFFNFLDRYFKIIVEFKSDEDRSNIPCEYKGFMLELK